MKRLLAFILLVAIVCSLCVFAPSAAALSEEEEALYTKYADLIALLEAEDYESALGFVWDMMPAAEYEEVVLTEENFFDYFEIVPGDPYIEKTSSGEIKSIYPGGLYLALKEEFVDRLDWENSGFSVGVTAKKDLYRAKINWETGEITLGSEPDADVKKAVKKLDWFEPKVDTRVDESETVYYSYYIDADSFYFKHPKYKAWNSGMAEPDLDTKYYQVVYRDLEISGVEGSLFIKK